MFGATEFRELISGQRRGAAAAMLRGVLRAAEVPYTIAVNWRNRRYDRGQAVVHRANVPVISVGNLTLGGTGKTPMVKWLVRWLVDCGLRPAIVSRGYAARDGESNDEALELYDSLPEVPHVQDPNRVAAARRAIEEFNCQIIVLDDGFQHRRLARDLNIVLLDAMEPFGHAHVFPRGTLREPVTSLRRAHVVCLSRADAVSSSERQRIRNRVVQFAPHAVWCGVRHAPTALVNTECESQPLEMLIGKRVIAFCGIGNPDGFYHSVKGLGAVVVDRHTFPDHHAYSAADLSELQTLATRADASVLLCTHKDLVKIRNIKIERLPVWALAIDLQFITGQEALVSLVQRAIQRNSSQPPGLPGVHGASQFNGATVSEAQKTPGETEG
jgi:tetraacyldisaccharide 4'-kinase